MVALNNLLRGRAARCRKGPLKELGTKSPHRPPAAQNDDQQRRRARIGTGPRAVRDAESGEALEPGVVIYLALLWVYGLLGTRRRSCRSDKRQRRARPRRRPQDAARARSGGGLDNDF